MYNAFIFDFDGVLVDSVEVKTKAFAKLFEKYGQEVQSKVMEHHRNHSGMARKDKFIHYFREFLNKVPNENQLQKLCTEFSHIVAEQVVSASEIPGAEVFLIKWCQNIKSFINSATPDHEIHEIIKRRGWQKYFKEILGSGNSKTENLKYLLKKFELDSSTCLFFGDAVSDFEAAKNCGLDFLGIAQNEDAPLLRIETSISWIHNFTELNHWENDSHFLILDQHGRQKGNCSKS
jgi:HAD superfamily hydrolase (TIGR01549 family)